MSIFRVEKTKNYTVMSNYHLRDKNLSFKAKGLLSYMLSRPDDWDFSLKSLCTASKDNISSIRSALKELQERRYLVINKLLPNQTSSGRIESEYIVYECPFEDKKQDAIFKPCFSNVENHTLLNTNIQNTKKNTKKRKSKIEFSQREYSAEELENLYNNF